jgi:tetratricopeptide (TPR) repeat protein
LPGARGAIAVAGLGLSLALAGCAARQPANRFIIRNGHGPIDGGRSVPMKKADHRRIEQASREAVAKRAAERPEALPSIERLDKPLREALAALGRQETPAAHLAVAQNYWRLRVYDAAFDHYSDALTLDPKNVVALDGRARVWRHWGMTGPALSDVHRALYYGPNRPDALNTLGTILEAAGQCAGARDAYARAASVDPAATWAKSNLDRLHCEGF